MKLTVSDFLKELEEYGIPLELQEDGSIRTPSDVCPIEALARKKKLKYGRPKEDLWLRAELAGTKLGLSVATATAILCAADNTTDCLLQGRSLGESRRARKGLLALVAK